jgi:N-(2-amino-2-carboxyethyl)-L-glutamate synthase
MIEKLESISRLIGNTPFKKLNIANADVYVKLEYNNFSGSIKDRAAFKIISEGIRSGNIREHTTIIESSSGNFAIALASICKVLGLKFIAVIDPNINQPYEELINLLSHKVVKVNERDETGGYLLSRIKKVQSICARDPGCYWTNQYENPNNFLAYYETLGVEICDFFDKLDLLFIGVSSGGTITGVSRRVKEKFSSIKVVGVDVEGSVIFNQRPKKRHITGIGASKIPSILAHARIDDIRVLSEANIIGGCRELLDEQMIFGGASAGASYAAVKAYLRHYNGSARPSIGFFCPDRGTAYVETIYNEEWIKSLREMKAEMEL